MNKITRRSFIKSSATTAAATLVLPKAWYSLARAGEPAYFEREFGITDGMGILASCILNIRSVTGSCLRMEK